MTLRPVQFGYILGVKYGDGCLYEKKRIISLEAIDKEFVEEFSNCISIFKSRFKSKSYSIWYYSKHNSYICKGTCPKPLLNWLTTMTYPKLEAFLIKNKEISRGFLKGFFDSEGTFNGKYIWLTCIDKSLLELCRSILKHHFNIRTRPISTINGVSQYAPNGYTIYRLYISVYPYVQKYINEIGFTINRKNKPLELRTARGGYWINEENSYILYNWKNKLDKELAIELNNKFGGFRTTSSVAHRRQRLGLWREKGWNKTSLGIPVTRSV